MFGALPSLLALLPAVALSSCSPGTVAPAPVQIVGSVGNSPGRFRMPRSIAVDARSGRFYVVDRTARVQGFDKDGALVAGWSLPAHEKGQPVGLALEADGSVLVNDSHYSRILRYSPDGELLAEFGSEGLGPGEFTTGRDVVVDSEGFIYAGDYGGMNDRIEKFTPDGRFVLEWGGRGEAPGEFRRPQGMAIEAWKDEELVLVADACNHRIQRFTRDGAFVSTFGRVGRGAGEMRYPYAVAVGTDGTLFVAEWGNNRIQRFDRDGNPLGFWGRDGRAPGELATPWDVAVGPGGRLYVADYGNHRIQIFEWRAAGGEPLVAAAAGGESAGGTP